jgi:hypothetical protein
MRAAENSHRLEGQASQAELKVGRANQKVSSINSEPRSVNQGALSTTVVTATLDPFRDTSGQRVGLFINTTA